MFAYLKILNFEISVYFLFLSLTFTFAVPLIIQRAKALSLSTIHALDLYLFVLIGSFLGSRVMYVLYQEPFFYWSNPKQIFFFWNGGYIFFGGFLGAIIAGLIFCHIHKEPLKKWLNFSIPILSLSYAIGRIACLLSGCCYGKELNAWWSVFMHHSNRHPTQLYASIMELFIFSVLILVEKKKGFKSFLVLPWWMVLHGTARIVMEQFRADPRGMNLLGVSISTNISVILIILGLILFIKKLKLNP